MKQSKLVSFFSAAPVKRSASSILSNQSTNIKQAKKKPKLSKALTFAAPISKKLHTTPLSSSPPLSTIATTTTTTTSSSTKLIQPKTNETKDFTTVSKSNLKSKLIEEIEENSDEDTIEGDFVRKILLLN